MSSDFALQTYGSALVLGLGKTGIAAAQYFLDLKSAGRAESVTVYAGAKSSPLDSAVVELEHQGARVVCGIEDIEGSFDACVTSPGISEFSDFYKSAQAHATVVMSEPELAYLESPERWVGITGTNGKTTTTTLVRDLLRAGGALAEAVGNIGTSALGQVAKRPEGEWLVAEMSSFQCAGIHQFHPKAAILLNVTPDHLYWHNTMQNYADAKEKLFANLDEGDLAIININTDDEYCKAVCSHCTERGLRTCAVTTWQKEPPAHSAYAAWLDKREKLMLRFEGKDYELVSTAELSIKGEHNIQNALCAAAAAFACGVDIDAIRKGLKAFAPLEHRIEPCGTLRGTTFINDSKATNTDAVSKALGAFKPGSIVILLGGHDKGTDLSEMCADVVACARVAVCFGEAAERIAQNVALALDAAKQAGKQVPFAQIKLAPHLEQALDEAIVVAKPGETILLSPACSSFDEFNDFEERGRVFKQLVAKRIAASEV